MGPYRLPSIHAESRLSRDLPTLRCQLNMVARSILSFVRRPASIPILTSPRFQIMGVGSMLGAFPACSSRAEVEGRAERLDAQQWP